MAKIERFEDLDLWKDAVKMGVLIYKVTEEGKMAKDFSARDQLRRAAISVSNNIADGLENTCESSTSEKLIFKFFNL